MWRMWTTSEIRGCSADFGAAQRTAARRSGRLDAGTGAALPRGTFRGISMRTLTIVVGLVLTGASACSRSGTSGAPHAPGQTSFESPPPGGAGRGGNATSGATAGAPAPATATAPDASAAARTVEEADIYKVAGSTLYVLNAYRGLLIVDLSDLAQPRL